ncbi:hypothetical protein ACIBCA_19220 [Kitasatospora sp. NPDC051170]|uniref:hypothetical protein n=1 Tax=Kitasatospora sp. NPDC051170 TaxID=3364056 RepID=UPI0037A3A1E5
MKKITAALGLAATLAASTIALAPSASALSCQENTLYTGPNGTVADTTTKANDGCHDVNLVMAGASAGAHSDGYMGVYKDGNGVWHSAASGYHWLNDGYYSLGSVVLISNLTSGRTFGVTEYNSGWGVVKVQH